MNSILYYQKQYKDPLGRNIYIGEDAYPYADSELIIVADGLGGRGGYPHTKIDRRILNKEEFYDIVFSPVFEKNVGNEFRAFIINSFDELFDTKEYYFDVPSAKRHSGYFASRLATAIALYEFKYNDELKKEAVFSKISTAENDEDKESIIRSYGNKLADLIKEKMQRIAYNIGFQVETKVSGAYLLPSTLVASLINEHDDEVEVLYFWAGDSRGYLWNSEGLAQVTADHEIDGTMTNLITLSKEFVIESRLLTIQKPCVLFNATDGCYKCEVFGSPFDLEYIILESIKDTDSFDDASNYLSRMFSEIGQHDDSNTMALVAYGYRDYSEAKDAVTARLKYIEENIVAKLPGILERDYPYELQLIEEEMDNKLQFVKDEFVKEEQIVSFVKCQMEFEAYRPYFDRRQFLSEQRKGYISCAADLKDAIRKWVADHWIEYPQMKQYSFARDRYSKGVFGTKESPYESVDRLHMCMNDVRKEHYERVKDWQNLFVRTNRNIRAALDSLSDINVAESFDYNAVSADFDDVNRLIGYLKSLNRQDTVRRYRDIRKDINDLNSKFVQDDSDAIDEVLGRMLNGDSEIINAIHGTDQVLTKLDEYFNVQANIKSAENEYAGLTDAYWNQYWIENSDRLARMIREEHKELIPNRLTECISKCTSELNEKLKEIKQCCEVRDQIYSEYDIKYKRVYRESII